MKPFLKWAGGKRWLTTKLPLLFDVPHERYIEPFLGSGAVFFHLEPAHAIISDRNEALINLYQCLKLNWKGIEDRMREHQLRHSRKYYYDIRSCRYRGKYDRAAQFLYLNRTCWNGLYRENLRGEFNVPIGTKTSVLFDDDDFKSVARILSGSEILAEDFAKVISNAASGDFVFIDPPYTVMHNNNGFIKYNENIFSWDDQQRLSRCVRKAVERGATVLMTNAFHESVLELYNDFAQIIRIDRASIISGTSKGRGRFDEALILAGDHWLDGEFYTERATVKRDSDPVQRAAKL